MSEYYGLGNESIERAKLVASSLRGSLRRENFDSASSRMFIGRQFVVMRTLLSKAMFADWVKNEVGVSRRTAQRYMALFAAKPIQSELAEVPIENRVAPVKVYVDSIDVWLL